MPKPPTSNDNHAERQRPDNRESSEATVVRPKDETSSAGSESSPPSQHTGVRSHSMETPIASGDATNPGIPTNTAAHLAATQTAAPVYDETKGATRLTQFSNGARQQLPSGNNAQAQQNPSSDADSVVVRRNRRIEAKTAQAKRILQSLPPDHPRRRILHAAVVRRDEVLLDGLIQELS